MDKICPTAGLFGPSTELFARSVRLFGPSAELFGPNAGLFGRSADLFVRSARLFGRRAGRNEWTAGQMSRRAEPVTPNPAAAKPHQQNCKTVAELSRPEKRRRLEWKQTVAAWPAHGRRCL